MTEIKRTFAEDGSRYEIDWGPCHPDRGFCQIDTDQDASYFGIWTNPERMIIASFIEGDIEVETATDPADYRTALVACLTRYKHRSRSHAMIDLGLSGRADIQDQFNALGLNTFTY
jgi:hypothetical protein